MKIITNSLCSRPPENVKLGREGDVTREDSQRRFLAQHSVTMLEQCCSHSKQCCNAVLR